MKRLWPILSRSSFRHPYLWLAFALVVSIPAVLEVRNLGLDTNLKRLLPEHSPSVRWSQELEQAVGDGGYFSVLIEGDDPQVLQQAVQRIATRIEALPTVYSAQYRHPKEFIDKYRYTLVPNSLLLDFQEIIEEWEIEVNPFLLDLDEPGDELQVEGDEEESDRVDRLLDYYANMGEYHTDPDDRIYGVIVRTREGISNLSNLRTLYRELQVIAGEEAEARGLWWGIDGNLRSRVDEFDIITSDLTRAGWVSIVAILLTLAISFHSIRVLPVILFPLLIGLLWSFALVPTMVGDLNTITAFLLLVLFGMGVDYAIHLVARFQFELTQKEPAAALDETLRSTGHSVATSAATTAVALFILAASDFRGFSDFGVIGGASVAIIALSMMLVMPATLVLAQRFGLAVPRQHRTARSRILVPPVWVSITVGALTVASLIAAGLFLSFDYDFTNLRASLPDKEAVREKHKKVYAATSAPAAIYVAADVEALDLTLAALEQARDASGDRANIGDINSIRTFAPQTVQFARRLQTIAELRESLEGRWIRRLEDPDKLEIIEDFLNFQPPEEPPRLDEVPASILEAVTARDGSGEFIIGVDTNGRSRDGRMAMAFTEDLYDQALPQGVRGPTGDKPIMAEILWLVTSETPWILGLTFVAIFLLVLLDRRSVSQTVWVMVPLLAGLLLTVGWMVLAGWKLNFFNMVVLPTILGVGVDHGVHYYRRYRELHRDTRTTHDELFGTISVCSLTTIMGYLGMVLAHHPGLRSIGALALAGLTATWITSLVLLPGLLGWRERRHARLAG